MILHISYICSPIFLIYDEVCYNSYCIYKTYVKFIDFDKSKVKNIGPNIDYNKVKEALDKLNLDV